MNRCEPGPTGNYGAGGIARKGMTSEYATALWRDDPSAFWLHPDGPLAETAPDEYFIPRPEPSPADLVNRSMYANGLQNNYAHTQGLNGLAQYQSYQGVLQRPQPQVGLIGAILPRVFS